MVELLCLISVALVLYSAIDAVNELSLKSSTSFFKVYVIVFVVIVGVCFIFGLDLLIPGLAYIAGNLAIFNLIKING